MCRVVLSRCHQLPLLLLKSGFCCGSYSRSVLVADVGKELFAFMAWRMHFLLLIPPPLLIAMSFLCSPPPPADLVCSE